jgi:hypothetical protein
MSEVILANAQSKLSALTRLSISLLNATNRLFGRFARPERKSRSQLFLMQFAPLPNPGIAAIAQANRFSGADRFLPRIATQPNPSESAHFGFKRDGTFLPLTWKRIL